MGLEKPHICTNIVSEIALRRMQTDLSKFNNDWYSPGAGGIKRLLWYFTNVVFFINPLNPVSGLKVALLRLFGAKIGKGVVIKPAVNIKYPWFLEIGDYAWVGEEVWIDNLQKVTIGAHACISQGALLLCGSHNYKKEAFDLIATPIVLEQGAWVGAKAIVTGGLTIGSHAVLSAGSVATSNLLPYTIYQGNPALAKRSRTIES
jgi:putative colanic acid biosynthesis acetyltransferase WcaF